MAYGSQLPVRLDLEVEAKLEEIAQSTGTTKSSLIRLLAKTFVEHVVDKKGRVNLPPNWQELLIPADGRSQKRTNLSPKVQAAADALTSAARKKVKKP